MGKDIQPQVIDGEMMIANEWDETLTISVAVTGMFKVMYRSASGALHGVTYFGRYPKAQPGEPKAVEFPVRDGGSLVF